MNAVVVTNIGRDGFFGTCRKTVQEYCHRFGLAFEVIDSPRYRIRGQDHYQYLNFEKNQVYELFDRYERILRLDTDTLITPHCPDVFSTVPEDRVGAVLESVGPKREARLQQIRDVQMDFGDIGWKDTYFNSGVVVASRVHRELFRLTPQDIQAVLSAVHMRRSKEQTLLNYRVQETGVPLHVLDFRFNHMDFFSEDWNGSPRREDSYIIHQAGGRSFKAWKFRRLYKGIWKCFR